MDLQYLDISKPEALAHFNTPFVIFLITRYQYPALSKRNQVIQKFSRPDPKGLPILLPPAREIPVLL
jgi:hypothetical protein